MTTGVEQIQASLAQARDAQVARVVAMVDALPERGVADALIAPLRPRLAQLRLARPPGLTRLLFTPLNPVIMPAEEWQRCGIGLPRTAIAPLGAALRAALPGCPGEADRPADDGAALWTVAAGLLDRLAMPPDWAEATGLPASDFPAVICAATSVLHEAPVIERLAARRDGADDADMGQLLRRSRARGAVALDTVVAVLLARMPCPARVAALAVEEAGGDGVTRRAVDRLAESVSADGAEARDVREAALEAARVAVLLDALQTGASPERRGKLDAIRRRADALSRRCFNQAVSHTLAVAQASMTASWDDEAISTIEASARDLRRLETAGRRLGSGEHYDSVLATTATALRDGPGDLGLADMVRLVEILSGPEQAMALLASAGGKRPPDAT